ncbi:TPA: hypothetical protein PXN30_002057 [Yersinia enterocolitica]|uniref:Uncharacterized protein n=1 Tax=Yersinia aldovae TaxID=29483 RepID=A0ABP1YU16_YERAL|nr:MULTISPECIES: hypothetical protein [Yersinia]EKN6366491.1 hypothetical protein [Yersinia enterocolitica]ELZ1903479.1 hypothetical protein [Yersinia enterocolitica]MCB5326465.1 hypothetical protein [Yersinia intermedia]CNL16504.1 Uncharacterised protein [Yersinia aldovae]HDL7410430.1 hypothetical protein [Yersinia enterocolitica]
MTIYNRGMKGGATLQDIRSCRFYLDYLSIIKQTPKVAYNSQDINSCLRAINQTIINYSSDKSVQTQLLAELEMACDENIIPLADFDWLRENERAAFWLWGYIRGVSDFELKLHPQQNSQGDFRNWYLRLGLNDSPCKHQERIDIIVNFFDGIIYPAPPKNYVKSNTLAHLKAKWTAIYRRPEPVKWLPNEESIVLWAWNNIKTHLENMGPDRPASITSPSNLTDWFVPQSHAERLLAIRASLDLWDNAPDNKQLFLLNLNKAWNQRKLRQSRTDKKALNSYLKNETKLQLDKLAVHYGMRISDVLDKLITEHYRDIIAQKK